MSLTRELLRAEIRSTAFHRRIVKQRSRRLFAEANLNLQRALGEESEAIYLESNPKYLKYIDFNSRAIALRGSRSSYARSLNIASGLLRGFPYKKIEAKCSTPPDAQQIYDIIMKHVPWNERKSWTLQRVAKSLKE